MGSVYIYHFSLSIFLFCWRDALIYIAPNLAVIAIAIPDPTIVLATILVTFEMTIEHQYIFQSKYGVYYKPYCGMQAELQ